MGSVDGWVGVGLTVISIALAIWALPRQVPKARIQWVLWKASSLIALPEGSLIEVTVDGRRVTNAWLLTIRVSNTGRQSFNVTEWDAPLELIFEGSSQPVSAHVSAVNPRGLKPEVNLSGQIVAVDPALLNSGDMFELQIVGDGPPTVPSVTTRIRNVPKIRRRRAPYNPGTGPEGEITGADYVVQGLFVCLFVALTVGLLANASSFWLQALFILIGMWIFFVALVLFLIGAARRRALCRPTYSVRR